MPNEVLLPAGSGRWMYARQYRPDGEPQRLDDAAARRRHPGRGRAAGPGRAVDAVFPFTMTGALATTFRAGAGFLVGDAAHRMTPMGGTGMNTAVHAAHNLGWRLAWAARGLGGDALLDGYEAERRPRRPGERAAVAGPRRPAGQHRRPRPRPRRRLRPARGGESSPRRCRAPGRRTSAVRARRAAGQHARPVRRPVHPAHRARAARAGGAPRTCWPPSGFRSRRSSAGLDLRDDDGASPAATASGTSDAVLVRPDGHCGPALPAVDAGHSRP